MRFVLLLLTLAAAAREASAQADDSVHASRAIAIPGARHLTLKLGRGQLRVIGNSPDSLLRVGLAAAPRGDVTRFALLRDARRQLDSASVQYGASGATVIVAGDSGYAFVVEVPRGVTELQVEVEVKGNVTVDNVPTALLVRNHEGPVTGTRLGGTVIMMSRGGNITAQLEPSDSLQTVSVMTTQGNITLHLPADVKAALDLETHCGTVTSQFPLEKNSLRPIPHDMDNQVCGGTVDGPRMRAEGWHVYGAINGGGRLVKAMTLHGSIVLAPKKTP